MRIMRCRDCNGLLRRAGLHSNGCTQRTRAAVGGQCPGTFVHVCLVPKYVVVISYIEGGAFWRKYTTTRADAERIRAKNQRLIDREGFAHKVALEEVAVPCQWAARTINHALASGPQPMAHKEGAP